MLKLIVDNSEAVDSVMPMRWCVGKETLQRLKEKGVTDPYLFLVVVHSGVEVNRHLVPLDQMMEYVEFQRPGKHTIFGTIVWGYPGQSKKNLRKNFLGRDGCKVIDEFELEGEFLKDRLPVGCHAEFVELDVIVPAEFFAKEPPAWEKRWVNLWFETRPRDQCQFRKRRFVAYTIQPPAVLFWLMIKFLIEFFTATGLLLAGMRNVDLDPLIHLWKKDIDDVWVNVRVDVRRGKCGSVFVYNKNGRKRPMIVWAFMPAVWVSVFGVLLYLRFTSSFDMSWLALMTTTVVLPLILLGALTIFVSLLDAVRYGTSSLVDRFIKTESDEKKTRREAEKLRQLKITLEKQYTQLQAITCDGPVTVNLKALPKERQTVYLRFKDLKAKVCRPLAL